MKTVVGQVTADAQGSFAIDAQLTADGLYKFTAIALIGTQSSPESAPVLVTLDRISPSAPQKSTWLSNGSGEITLQWKSCELPGQLTFEIYRNDELVTATTEEEFIDSDLPPQSLVTYKLISEDLAGEPFKRNIHRSWVSAREVDYAGDIFSRSRRKWLLLRLCD